MGFPAVIIHLQQVPFQFHPWDSSGLIYWIRILTSLLSLWKKYSGKNLSIVVLKNSTNIFIIFSEDFQKNMKFMNYMNSIESFFQIWGHALFRLFIKLKVFFR